MVVKAMTDVNKSKERVPTSTEVRMILKQWLNNK